MDKKDKKGFLIAGGTIGGAILIFWIITVIISAGMSSDLESSDSDINNYTPSTSNETVNYNNSTNLSVPLTKEEEEYENWVKNDYNTWYTKAKSSSDMYNLYLHANNVIPPTRYKEFHEHYVKAYYYYYKMMQAEETGDDASFTKYNDLETEEESEYGELAQKLQLKLV